MASDRGIGGTINWGRSRAQGVANFSGGIWNRLGKTGLGRSLQEGLAADVGFYKTAGRSTAGYSFMGGAGKALRGGGIEGLKRNLGAKSAAGIFGKGARKALPLVGTALMVGYGYKEGGITGAISGGLESAAYTAAWSVGSKILGTAGAAAPFAVAAAALGGTAYGYYKFGEAAQRYGRKVRRVEMGTEVHDRFGNVSTLRQRSLMALNNTHVNGRMALGNEAALMHTPMF